MKELIQTERLKDRFIKYAEIDTGSDPEAAEEKIPSTERQTEFANILAEELKNIGLENVRIDENSFVYGTLPANSTKKLPIIGFLAHMDTNNDVPSGPVYPQIHEYKGGNITLKNGTIIDEEDLKEYKNHTVITSDGTTLLGADDKAGIAEIMEAVNVLKDNSGIEHPEIQIIFTPDEETGMGINVLDINKINIDFAYTVDGSSPSDIDTETFNAYNPEIKIGGKVVHCGYAYKKMTNALLVANDFISALPKNETPETTKEKEGYYFVNEVSGNANSVKIKMLVRDFDKDKIIERIEFIKKILSDLENKYPDAEITFTPNKKYSNMKENLKEFPQVVDYAKEGIKLSGIEPAEMFVRGGTDGSALTLKGLLTPNLGAGGINFHSKSEFVTVETMTKCTENILNIIKIWTEKSENIMNIIEKRRKN